MSSIHHLLNPSFLLIVWEEDTNVSLRMRKLRQRLLTHKLVGKGGRTACVQDSVLTPLRKCTSPPKPSFPLGPWKDRLTTQTLTPWKDWISLTCSALHTNDSVAHSQLTNSQIKLFSQAADTFQTDSLCVSSMLLFLAGGFTQCPISLASYPPAVWDLLSSPQRFHLPLYSVKRSL